MTKSERDKKNIEPKVFDIESLDEASTKGQDEFVSSIEKGAEKSKKDVKKKYGQSVVENIEFRRIGKKAVSQRVVFVPEPKQKWHFQLVSLIPKLGHEFDCPVEFAMFPYAKYEWLRIMEQDPDHKLITHTKREGFYSYCLMVERLRRCMLEWSGVEIVKEGKDSVTKDYLGSEIARLTETISRAAMNLGLFKEESKYRGKGNRNEDESEDEYDETEHTGEGRDDLFD